jgi:hypothetical protein
MCQLKGGYDANAATVVIHMNELEYVSLDMFTLNAHLDAETKEWHITPPKWTRFSRSLKAVGMPTACVGSVDAARTIILEYMDKLSAAERLIAWADAHVEANPAAGWMGKISAAKVRKTDNTNGMPSTRRCATCARGTGQLG